MQKLTTTFIAVISMFLGACSSDDPIKSLHSNSISRKFDENYWIKQQSENTPVWQKGFNLCNSDPSYAIQPNCQVVGNVALVAALSASAKQLHHHSYADGFGADNFPKLSTKHSSQTH